MKKKLLSFVLLLLVANIAAWAADGSGVDGNVTWKYTESTQTLTISGSGTMNDYSTDNNVTTAPWKEYVSSMQHLVIGNGLTSIGNNSFYCCEHLADITIGSHVTSIGESAFAGCNKLTNVTIPNAVITIANNAFKNCSGLTGVTIGNSVTSIGENAFYGCSSLPVNNNIRYADTYLVEATDKTLSEYNIKEGTMFIGDNAFNGCSNMTSITIPASITSIGTSAFSGCSALTSVTIPNSVTSIGTSAFYNCSGLTSVTIGNSVTSIRGEVFSGCTALTSITIPNSVTSIGSNAFSGCNNIAHVYISCKDEADFANYVGRTDLYSIFHTQISHSNYNIVINGKVQTEITIPASVTTIGAAAFFSCEGLTKVTIPNSVTSIGANAFQWCNYMTEVTIGNSVTEIKANAFYSCVALMYVTCLATTPPSCGAYSFNGIPTDATLYVPSSAVSAYKQTDVWKEFGTIEDIEATSSLYYSYDTENKTATVIKGSKRFSDIIIPATTEEDNVTYSVTSIGASAFSSCTGLTSVSIPNSVTSIGESAFSGCSNLRQIYSYNPVPPTCGSDVFTDVNFLHTTIYVPSGSLDSYCWATGWKEFTNIIEMASSEELTPSGSETLALTDANTTLKDYIYDIGKITYTRQLTDGNYATFCLPYEIDLSDYTDYFSKVYTPMDICFYGTTTGKLTLMLEVKSMTSQLPAGTPFLALCKSSETVTLKNDAVTQLTADMENPAQTSVKVFNMDATSGSMYQNNDLTVKIGGSYKKLSSLNEDNYRVFNTDGSFSPATWMNPFRMYVYKEDTSGARITDISICFDEDEQSTLIQTIKESQQPKDGNVYNLQGQRVNTLTTLKGLYITNGKKVAR